MAASLYHPAYKLAYHWIFRNAPDSVLQGESSTRPTVPRMPLSSFSSHLSRSIADVSHCAATCRVIESRDVRSSGLCVVETSVSFQYSCDPWHHSCSRSPTRTLIFSSETHTSGDSSNISLYVQQWAIGLLAFDFSLYVDAPLWATRRLST